VKVKKEERGEKEGKGGKGTYKKRLK